MEQLPSKRGRKFWGEHWWDVLHSAAAFYSPELEEDFRLLVQGYKGNIVCKECKAHFIQNLARYPIDPYLDQSSKLLFWTYIIHDSVNQFHNSHRPNEPPKKSPPFSSIVEKYAKSSPDHWDKSWRFVLHTAAAVYTSDRAIDYTFLVKSFTKLIPSVATRVRFSQAVEETPVEPYLRNNHDLFFWSYVISNKMIKTSGVMVPFVDVKRYYFAGLGEECKTCNM